VRIFLADTSPISDTSSKKQDLLPGIAAGQVIATLSAASAPSTTRRASSLT
jgi:hypothetical protein